MEKEKLSNVVPARLTDSELEEIKKEAELTDRTTSYVIRKVIKKWIKERDIDKT